MGAAVRGSHAGRAAIRPGNDRLRGGPVRGRALRRRRRTSRCPPRGRRAGMSDCVQVTTATDSREAAEEISRVVVDSRLGACAQIVGPVASRYWWQGREEQAEEWLVIV